jgi:hypothetical protein
LDLRTKRDAHLLVDQPDADVPEIHADRFELSDGEREEAIALLRAQLPRHTKFESAVMDGFPCHLVVAAGELASPATLACNLAGLTPGQQEHPAVRLALWMLAFRRRAAESLVVMGSCDAATGAVDVGGV